MMKRAIYIIALIAAAQAVLAGVGGFALDVDIFRGSSEGDSSLVDIVWSINRGALAFERFDSIWADTLLFDIEVFKGDEPVYSAALNRIIQIPRGEMVTRDYLLFDKNSAVLDTGKYRLTFTAIDLGDGDSVFEELNFELSARAKGLSVSEIALFSDVSIDSAGGAFSFGNLKMLPNPAASFGSSFPTMFVYLEAYDAESADTFELVYSIRDSAGKSIKIFDPIIKPSSDDAVPILNGFNVVGYPEGEYSIEVLLKSTKTKKEIAKSKEFSVVKKQFKPEPTVIRADTSNLERELDYIHYLISTSDKNFYQKLTPEGKAEFLLRWWENRDPEPRTPENEYRDEIIGRWNYANSAFGENGWLTDRGRVFIVYGAPDNIERSQFTLDSNPWEQWDYYSLQGGVYFIFADEKGIGIYRLVHSTASGEPFDTSWLSKLSNPHGNTREEER